MPPEGDAGPQDTPKILVDDDWKSQAQAEKAKLAEEEAKRDAERATTGGAGGPGQMPPADFRGLVGMLATQALLYLGGMPDPKTGQAIFAPDSATHMIDLLVVLEEKTRGNLTPEESEEIAGIIRELRSRFVELMQAMAEMQQQQAQGGDPGAAPGPPSAPPGGGIITP
ncbi:MAG: DUF1844 domain-containing protein [Planctomycetota bacterium]